MSSSSFNNVVKIQTSLYTTHKKQQVVIYNKDKSILLEEDLTKEVKKLMKGRIKAFFHYTVENGVLHIENEAEYQLW